MRDTSHKALPDRIRRQVRRKECGSKRRFKRRHEGEWAKAKIKDVGGELLFVYRCRFCGFWHLGH
jgi:rubrerythrin